MARAGSTWDQDASRFQRFGIAIAIVFYLVSVGYVSLVGRSGPALDPDVQTITFAHWGLEDGYREGVAEAIRRFEQLKAAEGQKVRIIQSAVPSRGYQQWFLTQLIGGNPADVIKLLDGNPQLFYRYFVPLTPYVDKPNPFNQGTVLEGVPWRDTFIDNMERALDATYSEYYGVGNTFHVYRLFVNVDLLEKATGSREPPRDVSEWLDDCAKLKQYGKEIGMPIIPIGVRGFDKDTIRWLFQYYFSQMTGNLNDEGGTFGDSASSADVLEWMEKDPQVRERICAVVDVVKQIGLNFGEGFTAMDVEQTKFLFHSGLTGFFPDGTWNAWSLVNNSPFEVAIIPLPLLGHNHEHSKYFTGRITEAGRHVGGKMGITKATKHFELALEFLQFYTSYEINQITMMDYVRWPPGVRKAQYKGILKTFQLEIRDGNRHVAHPFGVGGRNLTSHRKFLACLEETIIRDIDKPGHYFLDAFKANKDIVLEEGAEFVNGFYRSQLDNALSRSQLSVGLLRNDISPQQAKKLRTRTMTDAEDQSTNVQSHLKTLRYYQAIREM